MRRSWKAFGSLIGVGLASLISAPAWAAGQPANPYAGLPPMTAWVWNGSNSDPVIMFDFSGQAEGFPLNATISSSVSQNWGGIDNPAPLEWYYNNVSKTDLGNSVFGPGVQYSATLVSKMEAENFAPSLVGGVNPPGMTSGGSTQSSSSVSSSPSSGNGGTNTSAPTSSASPTPPATTATSSPLSSYTHSTAPTTGGSSSISAPTPTPSTASGTRTHTVLPTTHAASPAPSAPQSVTPLEPPGLKQETPPKVAQKILHHDEVLVAEAHHRVTPTGFPWGTVGAIAAAVVILGGGGLVWWPRRHG